MTGDKIKQAGIALWRDYCALKSRVEDLEERDGVYRRALVKIVMLAGGKFVGTPEEFNQLLLDIDKVASEALQLTKDKP